MHHYSAYDSRDVADARVFSKSSVGVSRRGRLSSTFITRARVPRLEFARAIHPRAIHPRRIASPSRAHFPPGVNRFGSFFFCFGRRFPSALPSLESLSPLHTPVPCILSVAPAAYMTPSAAVFRVQKSASRARSCDVSEGEGLARYPLGGSAGRDRPTDRPSGPSAGPGPTTTKKRTKMKRYIHAMATSATSKYSVAFGGMIAVARVRD